ncbi:MAG: sialidase family protein [Candidatus Helarchaeota archaeon]
MNATYKKIIKIYFIVFLLFFLIFTSAGVLIFLNNPILLFFPAITGNTVAWPSVTINSQDNIFLTYILNDKVTFQRSLDEGMSWSNQVSFPSILTDPVNYPAITTDNENRVFITYTESNYTYTQVKLINSSDKGSTFSPARTLFFLPSILSGSGVFNINDIAFNGNIFILYRNNSLYLLEYNLTTDVVYPPKLILDSVDSPIGNFRTSITFNPSNNLFLTFYNRSDSYFYCMNSSDEGSSWSLPTRISSDAVNYYGGPIISTNNQDDLLVFYKTKVEGGIQLVMIQKSHDQGESWSDPEIFYTSQDTRIQPVLAAAVDSQNNYFILWISDRKIFLKSRSIIEYLWNTRNLFSDVYFTIYFWNFCFYLGVVSGGYFLLILILKKKIFSDDS